LGGKIEKAIELAIGRLKYAEKLLTLEMNRIRENVKKILSSLACKPSLIYLLVL